MPDSSENSPSPLGIVIPAYNEADNIGRLVREIRTFVPEARVVVVDDSPGLATSEAVEALALPQVSVTHRSAKGGRGSAVLEGIRQLLDHGCAPILEMDADFSHPPSQIPELLREAEQRRLDLLVASRYLPGSEIRNWPLSRRWFSKSSNALARAVLAVPIVDYTNGFRLYSLSAARIIRDTCGKEGKGFIALSEILVNLHYRGLRIGETPTVFVNRSRGESSVNFEEIKNALTGLAKIWLLKRKLVSEKG
jgi:dolichol-phosphate mannosyltransferase